MNRIASFLFITAIVASLPNPANADVARTPQNNPSLVARAHGVDAQGTRRKLHLSKLSIDVHVRGSVARTAITAQFAGDEDDLEADFSLDLPEGAVVTGYALDIDDRMIDGVLADLPKAREVYQDKVRQGIDPGFATVSRANAFTTHVYPVRAKTGRTIRLNFVAPIHAHAGWALPLLSVDKVANVSVSVRAESSKSLPKISLPFGHSGQWQKSRGEEVFVTKANNISFASALRIQPLDSNSLVISKHASGKYFFQLSDKFPLTSGNAPDRLRVYWDRSRSRRDQAIQAELLVLEGYVKEARPKVVDIVTFNSAGATVQSFVNPSDAIAMLRNTTYRGATSFSVLEATKLLAADQCLLFSDGVATIDDRDGFKPNCALTAITSAMDADVGYLKRVVSTSGDVLTMKDKTTKQLIAQLSRPIVRVVEVRDQNNARLPFSVVSHGEQGTVLVGEAPTSGPLFVEFRGGRGSSTRRYEASFVSSRVFSGEGELWASQRIADLAAQDGKLNEVRALSKRYSIASPAMAFLVLESPRDYLMANIEPPKNYPSEARKEYREARAEYDAEMQQARTERIDEVLASWDELKQWWNTEFDAAAKPKKRQRAVVAAAPASAPPQSTMRLEDLRRSSRATSLEEVVVTASLIRGTPQEAALPVSVISADKVTNIELAPWNPDRPYLKTLNATAEKNRDAVLRTLEESHGDLPAFYLDVAEWFYRTGCRSEAMELLLSALELSTSNAETIAVVADRLLRYSQLDRAIWLYEQNAASLEYLPQPRRVLATALIKRAQAQNAKHPKKDLLRAVQLLNEIVMTNWNGDYDGIELIALMDANAALPLLRKAGVTKTALDPRLIDLLDVDLRVVIQWNTGDTDVDLWIDEPSGERVMYSNAKSAVGGRLSNDMTSGYGPEEYLLRRAPTGKYQIRLNVYAADSINPNGATVVTAHLIRDYGRATQREETIDLELKAGDEGEKLVGEFEVKR